MNLSYFKSITLVLVCLLFALSSISCSSSGGTKAEIMGSSSAAKEQYVTDAANLLSREQMEEISALLEEHNQKGLGRIYLCIIEGLPEGKTIEEYSYEKINEKPRRADEKRDKILIAVAMQNRTLRIETSQDVWPVLTDEYCKKITSEVMIPKFKQGEYYQGIKDGITNLLHKLET